MLSLMEYIKQHGIENVWCQPKQDTQYMIYPNRITKPIGASKRFSLMGQRYALPSDTGVYHVYMFGQLPPSFFNIMEGIGKWRKASTICNENKILIDLYLDSGIQFPRHDSWFIILPDKNILVAVKDQVKVPESLRTAKLAVKFYSNAFFSTERSQQPYQTIVNPEVSLDIDYRIYVAGRTILTPQDISDVSASFNGYMSLPGYTYGVVNGYMVSSLSAVTMQVGDVVEFVHDSTIKWVIDLPFSDLGGFTSTLDNKHKRLITFMAGLNALEKGLVSNATFFSDKSIYFKDDIDLFFYKTIPGNVKKGLIYSRNQVDSVRMLTHKDYSIPSNYIDNYYGTGKFFAAQTEMNVRLFLRLSGYERALVDDCNYINELYKLVDGSRLGDHEGSWFGPVTTLRSIMLGTESNVDCWKAANLEASSYTELMRSYESNITLDLAAKAYGHEGIKDALHGGFWQVNDVVPPESYNDSTIITNHLVTLAPGSINGFTAFKYWSDINTPTVAKATYLGGPWTFNLPTNAATTATDSQANQVIPIPVGRAPGPTAVRFLPYRPSMSVVYPNRIVDYSSGSSQSGTWFDSFSVSNIVDKGGVIRAFKRLRTLGENTNPWIEITDSEEIAVVYTVVTNVKYYSVSIYSDPLIWEVFFEDSAYLCFSRSVETNLDTGNSRVTITGAWINNLGEVVRSTMPVAKRALECFIAEYYAIEGLDYYRNGDTIVVCSASIVKRAATARPTLNVIGVTFRNYGTGAVVQAPHKPSDFGFVKNGVISLNGRFNLRDERTTCLYIDGELINIDMLRNTEDAEIISEDPGSDYLFAPELTGKPYCFVNLLYDIPELPSTIDRVDFENEAATKEQQISDYLTVRFPEVEIDTPIYAESPYELYSPFMFRVMRDVVNNVIMPSVYDPVQPTDGQIQALLASNEWLLDYDPALKNNEWWKGNVVILAHPLPNRIPVTVAQRGFLLRVNRIYFNNKLDINSAVEIIV